MFCPNYLVVVPINYHNVPTYLIFSANEYIVNLVVSDLNVDFQ